MIISAEFTDWAFGPIWKKYVKMEADIVDLIQEWNKRHADLFKIDQREAVYSFNVIEDMLSAFKKMKQSETPS